MSLFSALQSKPRARLPSPAEAISLLGDAVEHRAELATLEIEEARDHAVVSAVMAGASAALILFTGFAVTLFFASLVWASPHRPWWLAGLCLIYISSAIATTVVLLRRLRTWRPLSETQTQLQEDFQCLSKIIKAAVR